MLNNHIKGVLNIKKKKCLALKTEKSEMNCRNVEAVNQHRIN